MNMKLYKLILLSLLLLIYLQAAFSQAQSLKTIEPEIGYPQPLDRNKLKKELQKIEKIIHGPDNKPLTDYQRWLAEDMGYPERDILDVSAWGDDGCTDCIVYKSISASSSLNPAGNQNYKAKNVHDDNLGTAWIEGVEGYGIGESITFCFPFRKYYDKNGNVIESANYGDAMEYPGDVVTKANIYNGYMKSDSAWHNNSRVKQLKMYINGKPYALLNLKDTTAQQTFNIGRLAAVPELCLKFEITDVYKGDKYDDTAISEFYFCSEPCLCFAKGTMIALSSGEKAIENLAVGDKILTLNTKTNKVEEATILALANRKHHNLYELDFDNIKITVTGDHPFYFAGKYYSVIENNNYGVKTNMLIKGQKINFLSNGKIQTVALKSIKKLDACEETYTITKLDRNSLFFANGICVSTE